jgi:hypothetical protein
VSPSIPLSNYDHLSSCSELISASMYSLTHLVFGRAFISPDHASTTSNPNPSIDPSQPHPGMAGSIMIFRFDTIDQVWARIKDDLYWTAGVWDKENARVDQLLGAPGDEKVGEIKP